MSAYISIPSKKFRVFNRVRLYRCDYEASVIRYLDSYSYYGDILKVRLLTSPAIYYSSQSSIISQIPIFTPQEVNFINHYKGKVEIECDDINYILCKLERIWVGSPIVEEETRLVGIIANNYGLWALDMTGDSVYSNEIQPDLYIGRCLDNKIVITTGEDITDLDLFSSLITDTGENYSRGFEIGTWYGVIIKQVRKCIAEKSIKTVVTYGNIDDNNIYLYNDSEVSVPSLILPRYFLYNKPYPGREKLEICVEPIKLWKVNNR